MNNVRTDRSAAVAARRVPGLLICWRVVIAALAWWGLLAALDGDITGLKYWSQVSTLVVALTATAWTLTFAVRSPRWARFLSYCRGASTTYAIITAVIYQTLLSGFLESTSSLLEHAVVPALAVLDWVLVGPGLAGRPTADRRRDPHRAALVGAADLPDPAHLLPGCVRQIQKQLRAPVVRIPQPGWGRFRVVGVHPGAGISGRRLPGLGNRPGAVEAKPRPDNQRRPLAQCLTTAIMSRTPAVGR